MLSKSEVASSRTELLTVWHCTYLRTWRMNSGGALHQLAVMLAPVTAEFLICGSPFTLCAYDESYNYYLVTDPASLPYSPLTGERKQSLILNGIIQSGENRNEARVAAV